MKRLIFLLLLASPAFGQITRQYNATDILGTGYDSLTVTETWTTYYKGNPGLNLKVLGFLFANDSQVNMYVAMGNDTTTAYRFPVKAGEQFLRNGINVPYLRVKTQGGTGAARLTIH